MKILFFSPHSAIWLHAFPEALIAEALHQQENEILYITCGGQFSDYCICMSAYGLSQDSTREDKQKVCNACRNNKGILKQEFAFAGHDLEFFLTLEDRKALSDAVAQISPDHLLEFTLDGFSIGRIALFEIILQFKKENLVFSDAEWSAYLIAFKNTLASFFACRRILDSEKPERVITYSWAYSVNHICCQLAEARGIPAYWLHAGSNLTNRLQTMYIGKGNSLKYMDTLKRVWQTYKNTPCSEISLMSVTDHFIELLKGRHFLAYSSPRAERSINIRQTFGIDDQKKIILLTMSSYDERLAAEIVGLLPHDQSLIFPTQIDWVKAVIQFVKERRDLFFIIRVHPRDFPNKRDGVKSAHAKMLERELKDLPENVRVNWPTDLISLYDLAEDVDVVLNAWSSAGEEMSLLGLPVVIYSPELIFYPPDLNYVGASKKDFFEKIDQALKDGWSLENVRKAYRWYSLKFDKSVINFAESFSSYSAGLCGKSLVRRVFEKVYSKILRIFSSSHVTPELEDCRNRAKYLKEAGRIVSLIKEAKNTVFDLPSFSNEEPVTVEQETRFLKKEIRRLGIVVKSAARQQGQS